MTATESWPDVLPLPLFDGYAVEPKDAIARTEMESGSARQRKRFTQTPTRLPVRYRFTAWQFAIFESWYANKAQDGAAWFNISLLGGLGMVVHEARFLGAGDKKYSAVPSRGGPSDAVRWLVTTTLEIRERPVLSIEALDLALTEDVAGLLAVIDDASTLINTTFAGSTGWN